MKIFAEKSSGMPVSKQERIIDISIIFGFLLIVSFFLDTNSYLYDLWNHSDGACFYMSGKSLMNGLVPYVDFSDSKGPLLWLIYGLAYLISPTDYIGVFWIGLLFTFVTFAFYYKTLLLISGKRYISLIGTMAMSLFWFLFIFHDETRAEDFCGMFVSISLFYCLNSILTKKDYRKTSLILGISFGACLMIKFSIALMIGVMMLCFFIYSIKNKNGLVSLSSMILGCIAICLPFIVFLLMKNAFIPFINEYFLTTSSTVTGDAGIIGGVIHDLEKLLLSKKRWLFIANLLAVCLFCKRDKRWELFPAILCASFLFLSNLHAVWDYYLSINVVFFVFTIALLSSFIPEKIDVNSNVLTIVVPFVLVAFLCVFLNMRHTETYYKTAYNDPRFHEISAMMTQIEHPKIQHLGEENGLGIQAGVLPACKYWTWQNGATEDMINEIFECLSNRVADFVTLSPWHAWAEDKILEAGYVPCGSFDYCEDGKEYLVFCRPEYASNKRTVSVTARNIVKKINFARE